MLQSARFSSAALLLALAPWLPAANAAGADADAAPAWTSSGNVSAVSDYLFRGITQTQGKPTVQANLDFSHSSGAYVGLFGSGVSQAAYNHAGGSEIDLYGGYRYALGDASNIDVGLVTYWFAGAHYTSASRAVNYNTQDLKLAYNLGTFNVSGWLTVGKYWFGYAAHPYSGKEVESRGTTYLETNWNPEIAPGLALNLHAGHQWMKRLGAYNFSDVKVGLTKSWDGWAVSGALVYNDGKSSQNGTPLWTFYNADGSAKNVVGSHFLVTAARNF